MMRTDGDWPVRARWWRDRVMLVLVIGGAVAIPLVFVRDPYDMFRLPKVLLLRAQAILLVATALAAFVLGARFPRPGRRAAVAAIAGLALLAVLTLLSTNRAASIEAAGTIVATVVVFAGTVWVARRHGWVVVALPLMAAALNAALVLVEEVGWWMPFGVRPGMRHHLQCTALVGNPNEIGGYLGAAALACLAAFLVRRSRWLLAMASLLIIGMFASQTLTAIGAFVAGSLVMLAMISWKRAAGAAVAGAVVIAICVLTIAPFRTRALNLGRWTAAGQYNEVLTGRLASFVAAWWMFLDRPLTGVGPGAFAWQFYDFKIRAEDEYPALRQSYGRGLNFGEVHNDHLQVLAETGLPGYAFAVSLLAALGLISIRRRNEEGDARTHFALRLAMPLAVFWAVLSIAQFPLETAVVRSVLVHLAAVCAGWRR
jgi:O-antigen ligase